MRDHVRRRAPLLRRLVVEALDAEDVVDVPVRVDRGVHRRPRPAAHAAVHLRGELRRAGVDERQPALAGDGDDVGEAGDEGDAGRDLLEHQERRERMLNARRDRARPVLLGYFSDASHRRFVIIPRRMLVDDLVARLGLARAPRGRLVPRGLSRRGRLHHPLRDAGGRAGAAAPRARARRAVALLRRRAGRGAHHRATARIA